MDWSDQELKDIAVAIVVNFCGLLSAEDIGVGKPSIELIADGFRIKFDEGRFVGLQEREGRITYEFFQHHENNMYAGFGPVIEGREPAARILYDHVIGRLLVN